MTWKPLHNIQYYKSGSAVVYGDAQPAN